MSIEILTWKSALCVFRPVDLSDAEQIVRFRNSARSGSLSPGAHTKSQQEDYLRDYFEKNKNGSEVYVAAETVKNREAIGFFRIRTDDATGVFNWDSLAVKAESTVTERIDIILSAYGWGFELQSLNRCGPFPVLLSNPRVIKLHQQMGIAENTAVDDRSIWFQATRPRYQFEMEKRWRRRGLGLVEAIWQGE